MGAVTVETISFGEGQMDAGRVVSRRPFMAIETHSAVWSGSVVRMADRAVELGMRGSSEQILIGGRMRFVAGLTIGAGNRHAKVVCLETTRAFMTGGTQLFRWCRQHGWFG
jgi:hypothetical protein